MMKQLMMMNICSNPLYLYYFNGLVSLMFSIYNLCILDTPEAFDSYSYSSDIPYWFDSFSIISTI
jgi:hypothetical protein